MVKPAVFILGPSALELAKKIKLEVDAEIHAPARYSFGDVSFDHATTHLQMLFEKRHPIIGLCAAGILIRGLAPLLQDKQHEPLVIALAEDGSSIVPLLGGHHGANALAMKLAQLTKGHAALTTASNLRLGLALDEPLPGYVLSNPQDVKTATQALLTGAKLWIKTPDPDHLPIDLTHLTPGLLIDQPRDDSIPITLEVTPHPIPGGPHHLIYHPQTLVIGLGCERAVSRDELDELISTTLLRNNLSALAVAAYASIDVKQDEAAFSCLSPFYFFNAESLSHESHRLKNPSPLVEREVGTPGVAEAAALASAGPNSELIVAKTKSKRATIAIAQAPHPLINPAGSQRGSVALIGLGPGSAASRSPEATQALISATDWVGYDLYLDLAADVRSSQTEHRFPLGDEEARCTHALALAAQGKKVALICSGDPGIYAMAALVYELLELHPARMAVNVIPGISAFQAASARAGALIGHDFCCISLSDLLTPWEVIERRIKAAAQGDFVISFYNPRSLKRRDQLQKAIELLKPYRSAQTPVVIASNLGRHQERVKIVSLQEFNPDEVDMLTLVMIGSSQSRSFQRGDGQTYAYTPRGYAQKRKLS